MEKMEKLSAVDHTSPEGILLDTLLDVFMDPRLTLEQRIEELDRYRGQNADADEMIDACQAELREDLSGDTREPWEKWMDTLEPGWRNQECLPSGAKL